MATQVPAALKAADITRFAHRAAQLEKPKPIIAYWCEYWIVNQILSKGLHNADQESLAYTTTLMDKLEQFKAEHAQEPAVTDDVVGKAYVEQFGLETFERADNAVRANKASRQTADTFQASATFLDLLQIWGAVEPEIAAKIKFAKYHALRIAKALKAGEDPNLSNPKPQTPSEEALPVLDLDDAEVKALEGGRKGTKPRQPSVVEVPDEAHKIQRSLAQKSLLDESLHPSRDTSVPPPAARQPSVTDVPDEADRIQSELARQSSIDQSLHPSRTPSVPLGNDVSPLPEQDPAAFYTNRAEPGDISPLEPPSDRKPSTGGNYFPVVPSAPTQPILPSPPTTVGGPAPDLPSTPSSLGKVNTDISPAPSEPSLTSARSELGAALNQPPRHQSPPLPPHRHGTPLQQAPTDQSSRIPSNFQPQVPPPQPPANPPQIRQARGPVPGIPHQQEAHRIIPAPSPIHPTRGVAVRPPQPQPVSVEVDEEAILRAQKHARWAISALNFEDVPTAIEELRGALACLGGT
ncbi:uncharacterized protein Z519_11624 [Cladophialophora bantiana CBS 173.52]|uniref:Vta1/callose synthase N-terminal domain-containing protein n=1 Tax=Cladophialophora bantiana (strain ATCC 10958 / CBS 173.52 / CDC B-1940 / NIH 8579) TaxID=1442370 RepID=A0A0D2H9T9_CLAB1|nr:uncharacterized protein Z519_11624 [Cladophialophora bantiana CBS 173.52]KIW87650.1 hypothetical protein Z519_11624 [Cladophialophora bantiana CBS 173.52]